MAISDYYDSTGAPQQGAVGNSATIRAEFDAIESGFAKLPDLAGNGDLPIFVNSAGNGLTHVTAATARTNLGLAIGTDVQAYDAQLDSLAALSYSSNALKVVRVNAGETAFELATPSSGISDGDTLATGLTFPNTGLHVLDSDASHDLIFKPGSNITADRTLTITTGDADRTVTINGDITLPAGTALVSTDIGSSVQAYDADLTTWAGVTPGTGVATALAVNVGSAGSVVLNGGALGTPSSGTLTNATGLPVGSVVGDTSTALGVGSIELGHATDTTIARSGAGAITVEGVAVPTISSTNTLTNKRVQKRIYSVASDTTPGLNVDNYDEFHITALAGAPTVASPTGTPVNGEYILYRFNDDGTGRAITWNAIFRATDIALPTTTTAGKTLIVLFKYHSGDVKWDLVGKKEEA